MNQTIRPSSNRQLSLATAVVNSQVLTHFNYQGNRVYVYYALSNENENAQTPQKWVFYFVPIMLPYQGENGNEQWVTAVKSEVRIKLMLSNADVEELARRAIIKKYPLDIAQYSKYWDVIPLMIDSVAVYIVRGINSPVQGVYPYKALNPSQLVMTCRFQCSSAEIAKDIVNKTIAGDYEIEMAFQFSGFKQVTTNMASITSDQLKNVLSKTIADGGNTNAQYIHRNQGSTFMSKYLTNVKKMIYIENTNTNMSSLSSGLDDQFFSLLQQGFASSAQIKLDVKLYDQVWSPSDLNPDMITNELNKVFIYNQSATKSHNYSDNYFNFDEAYARSSSSSGGGGISVLGLFGVGGSGASSQSSSGTKSNTTQVIVSATAIRNFLTQQSIEAQWNGQKFIAKSFNVYKLSDISDRLQVAIVAKQLIAESESGAIVRTISAIDKPVSSKNMYSWPLTGEIKLYTGNASSLAKDWVFCHGQALSRGGYQRLFSVIGVSFGAGNGATTFNVPDFRGRFPLGLDPRRNETAGIRYSGAANQTLSIDHLPAHAHNQGTFIIHEAGNHVHRIYDPGHNHGGATGDAPYSGGGYSMRPSGGGGNDNGRHAHSIPTGLTGIAIADSGNHTHNITGLSGTVGSNNSFSIMPPSQAIDYIIFAG
ncbi:unnamed protein product [Rotaria sp. Silwood1]|nr:unnamed protein product [Rotaria sp. Silwood1]